jgi:lipopolysaccharide/colanic/teichoic acid biosynthesis glycosyltransferase
MSNHTLHLPRGVVAGSYQFSRTTKRLIDLVFGLILSVMAAPFVVVFAIGAALSLREWPFFIQQRVGKDGKLFSLPKIRTLPRHTPPYASKTEIDVHVARFTSFLRRRHLDELPQLFLVPLGKLSLVGPRPKMPDQCEPAHPHHAAQRVLVPQGCTGLWQVGRHAHLRVVDSPEYDLFYVRNGSLRLDFWIMWRTLVQFFGFADPCGLESVPEWARLDDSTQASALRLKAFEPAWAGHPTNDEVITAASEPIPTDIGTRFTTGTDEHLVGSGPLSAESSACESQSSTTF